MLKIGRSRDHLIFKMEIPICGKTVFILRLGPGLLIMTSWLATPLCGESTGHRWIPLTKVCWFFMFSMLSTELLVIVVIAIVTVIVIVIIIIVIIITSFFIIECWLSFLYHMYTYSSEIAKDWYKPASDGISICSMIRKLVVIWYEICCTPLIHITCMIWNSSSSNKGVIWLIQGFYTWQGRDVYLSYNSLWINEENRNIYTKEKNTGKKTSISLNFVERDSIYIISYLQICWCWN